ncbi:MAG: hydrogenase maturation protease [Nitrospira sp.]|nr:hydrogenase maturation protease [Nitrospira sp.]MDH4327170.1 hydrogenase maturation protease [Nitrospira sp.]MDH5252821.1 hydrogenase maturation protease [Nitrospira sp.]
MATIRIIGIGNLFRGDDAVGLLAARRLRERLDGSVEVLEAEGDGLALLDLMEGADQVMLIDAVKGGGQSGATVRLDLSVESRWGRLVPCSTHALGIAEAIDLARVLGRLPKGMILYGIEIESLESGAGLTASVIGGLDRVVEQVYREVEKARCTSCT